MDRKQYEEDLKRRQQEHIDSIIEQNDLNWQPCMHDACPECLGTGISKRGRPCIHGIACPCPKCTPTYCLCETVRNTNQSLNRLGEAFSEFAKVCNNDPNNRP